MKIQKKVRKNSGFSMIELIVAFAILGIVVVVVGYMMTTSSKTYRNLSVESELQSEAQLAANSISELAIDSMDAGNKIVNNTFKSDIDTTVDNKIVLLSKFRDRTNDKDILIRYQIKHDTTTKELYLVESQFDETSKTYGAETQSLLAQNIDNIKVDLSRVKKENILSFDLTYKKDGRSFTGNYQILMRNREYADPVSLTDDPSESKMTMLDISPKIVFMDIKHGEAVQYYKDTLTAAPTTIASGSNAIEFVATPSFIGTPGDLNSDWTIDSEDSKIFKISSTHGQNTFLQWTLPAGYAFKDATSSEFYVKASKSGFNKTASIRLRMVKSVDIAPQKGISAWKSDYSSAAYAGHKAVEAQGYAQPNGTVTVYANVNATNVKSGLSWKLYSRCYDGTGSWVECTDSSFAKVLSAETAGGSNTITLGKSATNNTEFKLEARSLFDDSVFDEYIFGVAPTRSGSGGGFYSRGYRTNMGDFFKQYPILQGNGSERQYIIDEILDMTFLPGSNYDFDPNKCFKWDKNSKTLYIDYETFQYSSQQRAVFYGKFEVNMEITYRDIDGVVRTYKVYKYPIEGVTVTPLSKVEYVIRPGSSDTIDFKTSYYNIKERKLIGVYAEEYGGTDFSDNLNRAGHEDTDPYITIKEASEYGDINTYVDNMSFNVLAKKRNNQQYPTDPITVRVTVDDFYNITNHTNENSKYDFTVYIANVENQGVFLPVPASHSGWVSEVPKSESAKVSISGHSTDGQVVNGEVYQDGSKIKCIYGAHTYVYDPTYFYWKEL